MNSVPLVSVERVAAGVAVIRLNRQQKKNALDTAVLKALQTAVQDLSQYFPDVLAVVLTGAGSTFSAGADIKEMAAGDQGSVLEFIRLGALIFSELNEMPQATIAAIDGYAVGGGLELALACDLRVASEHVRLGFPEVGLGGVPGWGGTVRAQELIGRGHATKLVLTGELIDADEAYRIGLVNYVVPASGLMEKSLQLAGVLASKSASALRMAKLALHAASPYKAGSHAPIEQFANLVCGLTKERHAALSGFGDGRSHLSSPMKDQ
ncbi:MAG: hypothetical protein EPN41_10590 [Candidimonas sp.]|nr:MAG: hypothetical protein EPN41_10590 [Candidimonas sp.]